MLLFIAGDHVPDIPFNDVVGNVNVSPSQIGAICVKTGVSGAEIGVPAHGTHTLLSHVKIVSMSFIVHGSLSLHA
jgi:hypothetical protein